MRGIGKGQTIKLLVVPEIADRINTQVRIGAGLPLPKSASVQTQVQVPVPTDVRQFLKDVVSWLVINRYINSKYRSKYSFISIIIVVVIIIICTCDSKYSERYLNKVIF